MGGRKWSEDEDTYLEYFIYEKDGTQIKEAAEFLGRTYRTTRNRINYLVKSNPQLSAFKRRWSKTEDDFLLSHYKKMSYKEISRKLNRSVPAIITRLNRFGLRKRMNIALYDKEIRELASQGNALNEIAKALNLNYDSVCSYLERNGIEYRKCTKEELKEISRKNGRCFRELEKIRYALYVKQKDRRDKK